MRDRDWITEQAEQGEFAALHTPTHEGEKP